MHDPYDPRFTALNAFYDTFVASLLMAFRYNDLLLTILLLTQMLTGLAGPLPDAPHLVIVCFLVITFYPGPPNAKILSHAPVSRLSIARLPT